MRVRRLIVLPALALAGLVSLLPPGCGQPDARIVGEGTPTPGGAGGTGLAGRGGTTPSMLGGDGGRGGTGGMAGAGGGQAGAGGAGGTAGTGGTAGAPNNGGAGGAAGMPGTGGAAGLPGMGGAAGSPGTGGAAGSPGTGGAAGSPGTGGAAGTPGTGGAAGTPASGGTGGTPSPNPAGLIAYFRFDDAGSTKDATAADASPTKLVARYVGTTAGASTSVVAPGFKFTNPASAKFSAADKQAVRIENAPAALKPAKTITLAAWVRTTAPGETEVVSLGDNYALRLTPTFVGFIKRVPGTWYMCSVLRGTKDGAWHHVAGVKDAAGMRVYVDGQRLSSCVDAADILYDQGPDLWIGRHGRGGGWDFDGEIDDLRIYDRALEDAEVSTLAAGGP